MKPNRSLIAYLSSYLTSGLSVITISLLGTAGMAGAQTWTNTTGTSNWSTGTNWSPAAPTSGSTTAVKFFATPGTVIPAASAITANQDIATPMVVNSLTVNGTGPNSGTVPSLTLSGGTIQFAGTSPALNVTANYGGVGYTVNLNTNFDFNADTAINFSNGGVLINVGTSTTWSGAGKVTFTGGLINRPLSLTAAGSFTGDVVLAGSSSVFQLNKNHSILGTNTATTQTITVSSGSGLNLAYGNAAYAQNQNMVISGNGNTATNSAALNITSINFGDGTIGGLALAADATVRATLQNASEQRGVNITRGFVGTGKLIKTGNAYLYPKAASPSTVTWGGATFSSYTGNVEIREGAILTPNVDNVFGSNAAFTQRVTVFSGASILIGAGNNAWTQPQNFILNGTGTGYVANNGGFSALDSFGAGFGNNNVRRIVVATDSTVAVKRDGGTNGLGRGLATAAGLSGTGTLTVGAPYGAATSPLYLGQAASAFEEFPAFSGKVIISNGILNIGHTDALGTSSTGQITLNNLGALSSSLTGGPNQAFLSRIANLSTTGGAVCLGVTGTNNLDFTSAPNLRLGAIGNLTYSGTLTPASGVYRLGGGGGTLTVSSQLTGSTSVVISGSVVLSNASNNFNGGVTIASNNTGIGQTASLGFTGGTGSLNANPITFGGAGGTLAYTGSATGSTDSLGALSFPIGHSNVTSTKGAAGNTVLSFSSLTARSAGATGNFTVTGGTNGNDNKITISGVSTGFLDRGLFFGGSNYAFYDASGYLRAPVYGTDSGFVTSGATTSISSATHQQITGALSAQNSASFSTLKVSGANNITLAASQTLTVDGLLKTGANATTISGGSGIQASPGFEMVVRADASGDAITINSPILDSSNSALTKTGAGSLTLGAANTYTGATTVVAGTLTVSGSGRLADTAPVIVNGGTYNVSVNDTVGAVTLNNGVISGGSTLTASSYAVENGSISPVLAGSGVALTKSTIGQVVLTGVNTYTGGTNITGGVLSVIGTGRLADTGAITISGGGTYEVGNADTVGAITLTDGNIIGAAALTASSYALEKGTISVPLAGSGTVTKSTTGTVTLSGANTLVSDFIINDGTLVLADNAKMNFIISGSSTTKSVSGSGAVTFDGDFVIDLTTGSPNLTNGNEWQLVDVSTLTETFGTTFNVDGFTVKPDGVTWTKLAGTKIWTFSETTGKLSIGSAGYAAWASTNNVLESQTGDDDKDGISNLVEYALGLNPQVANASAGTMVGNLLTFTKGSDAKLAGDVTYSIETSTTLENGSWTTVAATDTANAISFTLPANQEGGKLFARLKVVKP